MAKELHYSQGYRWQPFKVSYLNLASLAAATLISAKHISFSAVFVSEMFFTCVACAYH
jgi:hypothetical protein